MPHTRVKTVAEALHAGREVIAHRWLERIAARVTLDPAFVFPSEDLIDHVPLLIAGIADHLAGEASIDVDSPVAAKARELGRLRFSQGFSARQILWEYEILGALVLRFMDELDPVIAGGEVPTPIVRGLLHALMVIQRASMEEYIAHSEAQVAEREERLRGFNRALSHELRNQMGAILSAASMLEEDFVAGSPELRSRFIGMVLDNASRTEQLIDNLLELAAFEIDARHNRNVMLSHAAQEVARRLRHYAEQHDITVDVEVNVDLEVNAAAVDLALTNLIGNAIKYSRRDASDRRVRITANPADTPGAVIVRVADNGRGVPQEERGHLFTRLFRSDSTADVPGTGLGLSLVRDAVERVGGQVWAEFPDSGDTVFAFTLPARRAAEIND